jgi:hypothetical protein
VLDVFATLYAIYHLLRRTKDLTPGNSASYHLFALVMDAGLIPFYIFIGMLAHANYQMRPGTAGRWLSYFDSDDATADLINAVCFAAASIGGLHAISLLFDLYLLIMFKKIANMPPDMNPLEEKKDNLTRRKTKHKYKNSEITLVDEKHLSDFSISTISTPKRMSRASENDRDSQTMSFMQSRSAPDPRFSSPNSKAANVARDSVYHQTEAVVSRVNLQNGSHHRGESFVDVEYSHRTSPMPSLPMSPKRSSGGSVVSSLHSFETTSSSTGVSALDTVEDENNWYEVGDGSQHHLPSTHQDPYAPQPHRPHLHEITNLNTNVPHAFGRGSQGSPQYNRNSQHASTMSPLRMNPPTPPPQPIMPRIATQPRSPPPHLPPQQQQQHPRMPFTSDASDISSSFSASDDHRTRTMQSSLSAVTASSAYSSDEPATYAFGTSGRGSVAAPKSKFYGDLASAMRGVRQLAPQEPRPKSLVGSVHYTEDKRSDMISVSGTVVRKNVGEQQRESYNGYGRVVSRSGVDVMDAGSDLGVMRGRRDVSGKVAEEGRGGLGAGRWFGSGLLRRSSRAS